VPVYEMVAKLRATTEARQNEDTVIIARMDVISATGFDEAIKRRNMCRETGSWQNALMTKKVARDEDKATHMQLRTQFRLAEHLHKF
jgi:2-methylisocitrate lyase-like PEP mutase family enzyme